MTAYRWERLWLQTPVSYTKAIVPTVRTTNKQIQCGLIRFGTSEQTEECFHWRVNSDQGFFDGKSCESIAPHISQYTEVLTRFLKQTSSYFYNFTVNSSLSHRPKSLLMSTYLPHSTSQLKEIAPLLSTIPLNASFNSNVSKSINVFNRLLLTIWLVSTFPHVV